MISVVLVDDQAMIRAGLRGILEDAGFEVVGEAGNGRDGVTTVHLLRPDVVLMDLRMPILDGIAAIERIRTETDLATTRILALTTFDADPDVIDALSAGADGFLSKTSDPDELIGAIHALAAGEPSLSVTATRALLRHLDTTRTPAPDPELARLVESLTSREFETVQMAAAGADNHHIAQELHVSPLTVKTHLNRAMMKLGARDRGQLVAIAYRAGIAKSD